MRMNKRGASLSGWSEAAIGILLILSCITIIIVSMNIKYGKTEDPFFGMSSNSTKSQLDNYQTKLSTATEGDPSTSALSTVNVASSWGIVMAGVNIMFDFITGQWVQNAIRLLPLGDAGEPLGWALRLLFIFSIGYIIIKILFKVKP